MSADHRQTYFSDLERTRGRKLRRFLSSRLRNMRSDVPDLMQEIFLRLLRIKDHTAIRNPQAYLYTIASHVLHQHSLQHENRSLSVEPLEAVSEMEMIAVDDPVEELDALQRIEKVCRELEAISPRACATLLMYRCEGLNLTEIGARLGVSRPMAKKYLLKALAYCDRHLSELE